MDKARASPGRVLRVRHVEATPLAAATHVHPRTALGIPTFQKTPRPAGQPEDRYQRQTDLSAVCVPGECEGHLAGDIIEERGCVECGDHISAVWHGLERGVEVRRTSRGIVRPSDPDARPKGARLVQEKMDAKLGIEPALIARVGGHSPPVAAHEPED